MGFARYWGAKIKVRVEKIDHIKNRILKNHIADINFRIDEVLSICDSEIEKLMILLLYDYFQNYEKSKIQNFSHFSEIEFIEDQIIPGDPDSPLTILEENRLWKKIKKNKYRGESTGFYKYIGFKVNINWINSESIYSNKETGTFGFITQEFIIYPQFESTIDNTNFKIDIAIILNRRDDEKIIETRKIALECDGYDYHSSPEQKRNDDIRTRKLKKNGWREVFRYSGKELHGIKGTIEVHKLFEDIIEMLYL
jgi:hypothetical protein